MAFATGGSGKGGMNKTSEKDPNYLPGWRNHFPIFPSEDYDVDQEGSVFKVGTKSTYPPDLRKRLVAAELSYQFGLKKIDYTYSKILEDAEFAEGAADRLDHRISRCILVQCDRLMDLVYFVSTVGDKPIGSCVGEWTYMRLGTTFRQMVTLAHRGCLYETSLLGRMALEQIAWASRIRSMADTKAVKKISPNKCISHLVKTISPAGRLYGWLSSHAHWEYDAHAKSMIFRDNKMYILQQSCAFKAVSLTVAMIVLIVAIVSFNIELAHEIAMLCAHPPNSARSIADIFKSDSERPHRSFSISGLPDDRGLRALISEVCSMVPGEDLRKLGAIASGIVQSNPCLPA